MTRRQILRQLVGERRGLVVPGAYDGVSAKLVERAGFPATYMTGYGVSASRLGMPDMGFAGLAEMADHARNMAASVSIPLIADADTGYGNALSARRTVALYEAAGVAGLHLEDQQLPKRCGHLSGKAVVPAEEFAAKIRAAVEAPTTEEQIVRVARAFDAPLLFNYAPSGRSPLLPFSELARLGYAIILLPVDTLFVAARAIQAFLGDLRTGGEVAPLAGRRMPFADFNELIGVADQLALDERYSS